MFTRLPETVNMALAEASAPNSVSSSARTLLAPTAWLKATLIAPPGCTCEPIAPAGQTPLCAVSKQSSVDESTLNGERGPASTTVGVWPRLAAYWVGVIGSVRPRNS